MASTNAPRKELFSIMSGEKNAMYTLRHYEIIYYSVGNIPVYGWVYICNLSIDKERALEKASEVSGLPAKDIEFYADKLNAYETGGNGGGGQKLSDEEIAKRREEYEAEKQKKFETEKTMAQNGYWPFPGNDYNKPIINHLTRSSLDWWAKNEFEAGSIAEYVQEYVINNLTRFILPDVKASAD
jgi:hypothetical protein